MLVSTDKSQVLVIDIQDRIFLKTQNHHKIENSVSCLIQVSKILNIPVHLFAQAPEKLGPLSGFIQNLYPNISPYTKTAFSCAQCKEFMHHLHRKTLHLREEVILCGIESHICVLQTALDMHMQGYKVFCVLDAISSQQIENHKVACMRMIEHGIVPITTEMLIFEWVRNAHHTAFSNISHIVKSLLHG